MACQNCEVCEYKNLETGDKEEGFCYMFKDKPDGKCGQFSPIAPPLPIAMAPPPNQKKIQAIILNLLRRR